MFAVWGLAMCSVVLSAVWDLAMCSVGFAVWDLAGIHEKSVGPRLNGLQPSTSAHNLSHHPASPPKPIIIINTVELTGSQRIRDGM